MQNAIKAGSVAFALIATSMLASVPAAKADCDDDDYYDRPVVIERPVVVPYGGYGPGPGFYAQPRYGYYGGYNRPFSLHRFVGNAIGGALDVGGAAAFGWW